MVKLTATCGEYTLTRTNSKTDILYFQLCN